MERNFEAWFSTFTESLADYKYYADLDKAYENTDTIRIQLNILNSLVGSRSVEEDFKNLVSKYPETLSTIPILLAQREKELSATDSRGTFNFNFSKPNYNISEYCYFMRETGLFMLLQDRIISNLVDYVLGVEVGLSSNGKKNRGGHLMEDLVESYIEKSGFVKGESYFKEMYIDEVESRWGLDLSRLTNEGNTRKRLDFVIKTPSMVYGIETNFYNSSGSKLNEVARSYKTLALEAKGLEGFTFMWITDGGGWRSARHNLEETFDILPTLYNINDMKEGLFDKLPR